MNILIRDDDGHWYVIPEDKEDDFYDWCMDVEYEIDSGQPEWAVSVGGSPSLVKFPSYIIGE
jgi:hypothetical protein